LLSTDNRFFRSMVEALPGIDGSNGADRVSSALEGQLSRYLLAVTTVNALLGIAVAGATHALGLPNAALWGVTAMVLNYVPYVGGFVCTAILSGVALLTFADPWDALAVPVVFVVVNGIVGGGVSPLVLGRQMRLSPVAILLGVLLWSWLWGVAGALLAVPLLVTTSVLTEHVARLRPLGHLLRGE
jgi:predicted PurR-regulated permease PerM